MIKNGYQSDINIALSEFVFKMKKKTRVHVVQTLHDGTVLYEIMNSLGNCVFGHLTVGELVELLAMIALASLFPRPSRLMLLSSFEFLCGTG